jgi:hypothetical protein
MALFYDGKLNDGTSQCRGNNDNRDSMQRGFPHGGYLGSR